jgi:hypothetical protein
MVTSPDRRSLLKTDGRVEKALDLPARSRFGEGRAETLIGLDK